MAATLAKHLSISFVEQEVVTDVGVKVHEFIDLFWRVVSNVHFQDPTNLLSHDTCLLHTDCEFQLTARITEPVNESLQVCFILCGKSRIISKENFPPKGLRNLTLLDCSSSEACN